MSVSSSDFVVTTRPTLFHHSNWCSTRPVQLVHELGLEDEIEIRWAKNGTLLKSEGYMKEIHPRGKVPAFKDGALRLVESGAIFLHILDKYSTRVPSSLFPPHLRPLLYQYLFITTTSLYDNILRATFYKNMTEEQKDYWNYRVKPFLESHLVEDGYLDNPTFTVLDIAVTFEITSLLKYGGIEEDSKLGKYAKRLEERVSFQSAFT